MSHELYLADALALLKELIATPSVSRDETAAADVLARHMEGYGIKYTREVMEFVIISRILTVGKTA